MYLASKVLMKKQAQMDKEILRVKINDFLFAGLKYKITEAATIEKCESVEEFNAELVRINEDFNAISYYIKEQLK